MLMSWECSSEEVTFETEKALNLQSKSLKTVRADGVPSSPRSAGWRRRSRSSGKGENQFSLNQSFVLISRWIG